MPESEPFVYWVAHRVLHTADPDDPWIKLQRRALAAQIWNLGIFAQLIAFKLLPLARGAAGRVGSRQSVRHPSFLPRRLAPADEQRV